MKKIALCIMVVFGVFLYQVQASARTVVVDKIEDIEATTDLDFGKTFNLIKGATDIEYLQCYDPYTYVAWDSHMIEGEFILKSNIVGNNQSKKIEMIFSYEDSTMVSLEARFEDHLFYQVLYDTATDQTTFPVNEELDLYDLMGYTEDNYTLSSAYTVTYTENTTTTAWNPELEEEYIANYVRYGGFQVLRCLTYSLNSFDNSKEYHFVTRVGNPLTYEQIAKDLKVEDYSGSDVTITFEDSTYILKDGKIAVGTYQFTIRVVDTAGNITLQDCYIDVVDVEAPVITTRKITTTYEEQIIPKNFPLIQDDSKYSVEILEDPYTPNWKIPGVYVVRLRATDIYGNSSEGELHITVEDKDAPIIAIRDELKIPSTTKMSDSVLKEYLMVYDIADGDITEYTIIDNDGCYSETIPLGIYKFTIQVKDKSGNTTTKTIEVEMVDRDSPILKFGNYTIILNEGETLSKEAALEVLIRSGQIASPHVVLDTNFVFQSEESEIDNSAGEYILSVTNEAGETFENKIKVIKFEDGVDYTPVLPKDEVTNSNHTTLYVCLGSIGGFIVLLAGLSFIVYKKKH